MNPLGDPALHLVIRLALAAMFAAAALHKLRDVTSFTATFRNYRLMPDSFAPIAGLALPACELLIAIALLAPSSNRLAADSALLLLGLYSAAISVNLIRGRRDIDCGCLGPGHRQPLSEWLLVRNAAVAAGAACLLLPGTTRNLTWIDALAIACCVATLALLWIAANKLLETWPRIRMLAR